jgi:hypothetical protein
MSTLTNTTGRAGDAADEAQHHAAPWVERLARVGYAAKGVLYLLVGVLAARAAFGLGGQVGGSKDALSTLAGEGLFGQILLWAIAIGLLGYALWNGFRAILDPENEGDDKKGVGKRVFFGISGVIHLSLAIWVFTHLLTSGGGSGGSGGSGGTQGMVGSVLSWGLIGQVLVAAAALGILGYGIQQLIKAWKQDLSDKLMMGRMSHGVRQATIFTGRAGMAARGVIFVMVGGFIFTAAWQHDSSEAGGLGAALQQLGAVGAWALGLVAIGVALYGIHMFFKAKYRRIDAE